MSTNVNLQNDRFVMDANDRDVLITRLFHAPRSAVFEAWSTAEHLSHWYAPRGCTVHFAKFEFRPGGELHSRIHNPTFGDCWCTGIFREIIVPERIVFSSSISDENGNLVDPAAAGHDPNWPQETIVTVSFEEQEGATVLTLRQTVDESLAKRTGAYPSWLEMLDRLSDELNR